MTPGAIRGDLPSAISAHRIFKTPFSRSATLSSAHPTVNRALFGENFSSRDDDSGPAVAQIVSRPCTSSASRECVPSEIRSPVAEPLLPYRLGCLEQRRPPRRGARQRTRRQAQMREDPDDHGRPFDGGDDLQSATAIRVVFDIDAKDALLPKGRSWPCPDLCR